MSQLHTAQKPLVGAMYIDDSPFSSLGFFHTHAEAKTQRCCIELAVVLSATTTIGQLVSVKVGTLTGYIVE